MRLGEDLCGLAGTIQWTAIRGGDAVVCESPRQVLHLSAALIREVDTLRTGETVFGGERRCAMTDEKKASGH